MPTVAQLTQIETLIGEGKPQDAADLIRSIKTAEKFIADSAAAAPPPAPAPRAAEAIVHDFIAQVTALLGNPLVLETLLAEFRHVTGLAPKG